MGPIFAFGVVLIDFRIYKIKRHEFYKDRDLDTMLLSRYQILIHNDQR